MLCQPPTCGPTCKWSPLGSCHFRTPPVQATCMEKRQKQGYLQEDQLAYWAYFELFCSETSTFSIFSPNSRLCRQKRRQDSILHAKLSIVRTCFLRDSSHSRVFSRQLGFSGALEGSVPRKTPNRHVFPPNSPPNPIPRTQPLTEGFPDLAARKSPQTTGN